MTAEEVTNIVIDLTDEDASTEENAPTEEKASTD
jgi:hypothetical protein